jgi:ribose transport system ATP-binding protein
MSALLLQHIVKRYPGVVALDDVSLLLNAGEVHCLVGENGAGKSTLVKILSGAIDKDEGAIIVRDKEVLVNSPTIAQQLGIGVIHQDFKLVPELSVAENIVLGNEPLQTGSFFIDARAIHEIARTALRQLGEELDTSALVRDLGVAQRQIVEIAKALSKSVRVLAMDEPTSSLTSREIENLFRVIRRLKSDGVAIMYISHRLEEVFEIGDTVTVLRDGKIVNSSPTRDVDRRTLIKWMVGRELENEYPSIELQRGSEILRVEQLSTPRLHNIDLRLHRGEILGLAGLVGAGRTELARVLFGADLKGGGKVYLDGQEINPRSPHEAIDAGVALLTEDRNRLGLVLQMSVKENISLSCLHELLSGPFINDGKEAAVARQYIEELSIRPPLAEMEVENLSGGNRQKVVLARWLNRKTKVLIFDEPTAGIDVGAKYEIYMLLNKLAQNGVGVMMISSDLPELLGICTRIVVMCEGRITGVLDKQQATQEHIMELATSTLH